MGLDDVSIAAALLHDAVEDTGVELIDIRNEFGHDVAALVDGVTKLDRVRFATKQAQQAATLRKMLVAMAQDLRVLLIKLADRLHNMRTLGALQPTKQEQIARETLDVYSPLAHRLECKKSGTNSRTWRSQLYTQNATQKLTACSQNGLLLKRHT